METNWRDGAYRVLGPNGQETGVCIVERSTFRYGRPDRVYDVVADWGDHYTAAVAWDQAVEVARRMAR